MDERCPTWVDHIQFFSILEDRSLAQREEVELRKSMLCKRQMTIISHQPGKFSGSWIIHVKSK
jgi:hypothetical protein